jgi:hypothetical protein
MSSMRIALLLCFFLSGVFHLATSMHLLLDFKYLVVRNLLHQSKVSRVANRGDPHTNDPRTRRQRGAPRYLN